MRPLRLAASRTFRSGSVWEVSLYKQRVGPENDAGSGLRGEDKRLAEIGDRVVQQERQMGTNSPFAALP